MHKKKKLIFSEEALAAIAARAHAKIDYQKITQKILKELPALINKAGENAFIHTVKSGATQGGAGAAANEVWKTLGHATLPDNVLMIGV